MAELQMPGEDQRQRRHEERRRLWDRRAPDPRRNNGNRRSGERRSGGGGAGSERRASGRDRRNSDRRGQMERRVVTLRRRGRRRRSTPTPYSAEQIADLKERFAAPGPVSCPACGSYFTLGPARKRGADSARRVACLGCGRAGVMHNTRAARILIVDQVAPRRYALRALLASAGHEVIEADDAGVALQAYQTVPADVVFIDVLAPGRIQAPEFLRRLRRVFPDARVIAMAGRSSYGHSDPLAVVQGLGAIRTLRAPFSRDEVLKSVEEARP